jgi:hypothetical protein
MGNGNSDYEIGKPSHDYAKDLIATKGSRERNYLQVKHRLQLLRELFPEAKITTNSLMIDPEHGFACFHASVELPNGARGEGTGSETTGDFRDFIEKAETKAIGRALSAAGIGHQYGIADFEYESESPKEYVGVDSGVAPNRAGGTRRPANGNLIAAAATDPGADEQERRNREFIELKKTVPSERLRDRAMLMFRHTVWSQMEPEQQEAFLVEVRKMAAEQVAGS